MPKRPGLTAGCDPAVRRGVREVFDAEVLCCRVACRWIVFSGRALAFEAARLGQVRAVRLSNEMVDWAGQWHRHGCRLRRIKRVPLCNLDSSSEDSDGSW